MTLVWFSVAVPPPLDPHLFLRPRPPCYSRLRCDLQAFDLPEFRDPLFFGALALLAGLVVIMTWREMRDRRRRRRLEPTDVARPVPVAGLLVLAAALAGYQRTGHLVPGLALAILLLAGGGLVADVTGLPLLPRILLAAPGAYVLAEHSALPDPRWAVIVAGAMAALGAGLIADFDRRTAAYGLGPVLLAVSIVGLYECEPDPDFALLLVGAALPLVLLGWPVALARLGGAGAAAMAGLVAWAAAVGGRGMLSAVVSGSATLGLFAIVPVARLLVPWRVSALERLPRRWWVVPALAAVQLAIEVGCSRIAPATTPRQAAEIVGGGFFVFVATSCLLSGRRPRTTTTGFVEKLDLEVPSSVLPWP
jgi:hypothetical protein